MNRLVYLNIQSFWKLEIVEGLHYGGGPDSIPPSATCWQSNVVIFEFMTFDIIEGLFQIGSLFIFSLFMVQETRAGVYGVFSSIFQVQWCS